MTDEIDQIVEDLNRLHSEAVNPRHECVVKGMADDMVAAVKRQPLTCPCGFKGGPRNIRAHRLACPAWAEYRKQPNNGGQR